MGLFDINSNNDELKVGDWVYVKTFNCEGEIIAIVGTKCVVQLEGDRDTEYVEKSDLRKLY